MPCLTDAEILAIEARFNVILPSFYRVYLTEHDLALDLLDFGSGPIGENELITIAGDLVRANELVRDPALWFFGEQEWPSPFFVIGKDVYGCRYFIDTEGRYPGVRFQDIYNWEIEFVADDCISLIRFLAAKAED